MKNKPAKTQSEGAFYKITGNTLQTVKVMKDKERVRHCSY